MNQANFNNTNPPALPSTQNVIFQLDPTTGNISACASAGAPAPLFETNGTPNSTQAILNLKSGQNVTLTYSAGSVTFATTLPVLLRTNGVNNGDQTLLNLQAGGGTTLVDNGAGRVTITSASAILLETNGVPNASQTGLDLKAGAGISLVNSGIDVTLSTVGASGSMLLAPITVGGTQGHATVVNGIITAIVNPT